MPNLHNLLILNVHGGLIDFLKKFGLMILVTIRLDDGGRSKKVFYSLKLKP